MRALDHRLRDRARWPERHLVRDGDEVVAVVESCLAPGAIVAGAGRVAHLEQLIGLIGFFQVVLLQIEAEAALQRAAGALSPDDLVPCLLLLQLQARQPFAVLELGVVARVVVDLLPSVPGDRAFQAQRRLEMVVVPEGHRTGEGGVLALEGRDEVLLLSRLRLR